MITIIVINNSIIITGKHRTGCSGGYKNKYKEFKDKKIRHQYTNINTEEKYGPNET